MQNQSIPKIFIWFWHALKSRERTANVAQRAHVKWTYQNIGQVIPKIFYLYYQKKNTQDQNVPKMFYLILTCTQITRMHSGRGPTSTRKVNVAETSVRSPQNPCSFIIKSSVYRIKASQKRIIQFWHQLRSRLRTADVARRAHVKWKLRLHFLFTQPSVAPRLRQMLQLIDDPRNASACILLKGTCSSASVFKITLNVFWIFLSRKFIIK